MGSNAYGTAGSGAWMRAVCGGLAGLALCLALGPACVQAAAAPAENAGTPSAASTAAASGSEGSESGATAPASSQTDGQKSADASTTGADSAGGSSSDNTGTSGGDSAASGAAETSDSPASSSASGGGQAADSSDSGSSAAPAIQLSEPVIQRVEAHRTGVLLEWSRVAQAQGYDIYRWTEGTQPVRVAHLKSPLRRSWTDKKAQADTAYSYKVVAYAQVEAQAEASGAAKAAPQADVAAADAEPAGTALVERPSQVVSAVTLSAPEVTDFFKKASAATARVSWTVNAGAAGYQVQYSRDAVFAKPKTVWARSAAAGSVQLTKLKANGAYYVRVRAYADAGGARYYSPWSTRACVQGKKCALSKMKVGKKTFEIRSAARQKVYGYDTLQGSCSDGTFGYFALYNRTVENCKMVKVRLSDGTVVKVSGVLDMAHANDLTYNRTTASSWWPAVPRTRSAPRPSTRMRLRLWARSSRRLTRRRWASAKRSARASRAFPPLHIAPRVSSMRR